MTLRFDSTLLEKSETVVMREHMRKLIALDLAKDSSMLHGPILEASGKIVKAFREGDFTIFMAVLPELEALYRRCPDDTASRNRDSVTSCNEPGEGL